jgi:hypothetical protein
MLGHAALQHAFHPAKPTASEENGVIPTFLGCQLDDAGWIAARLVELRLDPSLGEGASRLRQLSGVSGWIVPWVDGGSARMDGDHAHDADSGVKGFREVDRRGKGMIGGLCSVVCDEDLLHLGLLSNAGSGGTSRSAQAGLVEMIVMVRSGE